MSVIAWQDIEPTYSNANKYFPPDDIGPVWQMNDEGDGWLMPEDKGLYTIGWDVIVWAEKWLKSPSGDGTPLRLTPEQMRIVLWHYAITEDGNWAYWKSLYQSSKGAGKDPFAAVLSVAELIGPCRFAYWDIDDEGNKFPVSRDNPAALVQFVGVSKAQTDNTMDAIPVILGDEVKAEYGLEVQKEIVYADNGRRKLQQIGNNWAALQGKRATYMVANEVQHWYPSQSGDKLYDVVKNNILKGRGHFLMITNAYEPGEESVHEGIRREQEKVWAGLKPPSGWLYMSREAHPAAPLTPEWAPHILRQVYGDAKWQTDNLGPVAAEVLDGATPRSQIFRMFYNRSVESESKLFTVSGWNDAQAEGALGTVADLKRGDEIVLGFDGGRSDDATALVAIRIKDKLIVPLMVEQKPEGIFGEDWKVQPHVVDEQVRRAFADYEVRAFFADTHLWESYIAQWSEDFRETLGARASADSAIGWDMSGKGNRKRVADAWESYMASLADGRLKHNGDPLLRLHAMNAYRGHNGIGLVARKEKPDSPRKIDAMVASYVAYAALQAYLEKGKKPARKYRRTMLRA